MTITDLQALITTTAAETLNVEGVTEQARLRGLTTETFGLSHDQAHLIAKLRTMGPEMRAGLGMQP